jgi:regulation of enolase protein 1 (concanavalin A-like superfamily)
VLKFLQPRARRVFTCAVLAACLTTAAPAFAQSSTVPGQLTAYSTIYSIGVEWDILYDTNHNAVVDVTYRDPSGTWHQASRLVRVDFNGQNMLAGSVMFLDPGTTYQVRLTLADPDGGSDVRELTVRTSKLPMPPTGRVFHVTPGSGGGDGSLAAPFRGIDAAQAIAQPGDTFLLHAGVYGARPVFHRPGTADDYVAWKSAGDGEVTLAGIDILASHLWFEGLTVRDQRYGTRTDLSPTNVVITRSTFINNFYSIYLNGGGSGWYIADNVIVGATPLETQSDEGEGIELAMTSGHTVAHNSITNVADGVSYPRANVDIFGNDIFDTSDDGLELDFGLANVRAWGNRIHNTYHNGISFQPQESGPWYIIRNQIVGNVESPFKFRTTDRFVLINNTIVNYAGGMICCSQNQLLRGILRNNLWISAQGGQIWALDALNDWRTDFDYDGFDWGVAPYPLFYAGLVYYDLPSFSAASGLERHGVRIFKDVCFADFRVPGPTPTRIPPHVMSLRADCNAVDAGAILPNLSDRYAGTAPDLGAHEYGQAAASYGPRTAVSPPSEPTPSEPPPSEPPPSELPSVPPAAGSPSPWPTQDIGAPSLSGSASEAGGVWTISGSGSDIWGGADEFHFVHQQMTGDGVITARLTTISNTNAWTKAGVMMRADLAADSPHAFVLGTPGSNGFAFQRRASRAGATTHASGGGAALPQWLRLVRAGSTITAQRSDDGVTWTTIGRESIPMAQTIYVGIAVTSHDTSRLATATLDNLVIAGTDRPPTGGLPTPWMNADVGAAGLAGTAVVEGDLFALRGSGADVWDRADAFHYAARSLTGDGTIVARVTSVSPADPWGKAGVMLRSTLDPSSAHAFLFVTPGGANGVAFQRRSSDGAETSHTSGGAGSAPVWLRLTRSGTTVTAWRSSDGQGWTLIGSDTIDLGAEIYAGLAVSSHDATVPLLATYDNVDVQVSEGTWVTGDIGSVGAAGFASMDGGSVVVGGSGADIWGTSDGFRYVYRAISGDFEVAARIATVDAVDVWTKAGLMVRASADPSSAHASVFATPGTAKGVAFQRRPAAGAASVHTAGPAVAPPVWLRLTRQGDVVTVASRSSTTEPWTIIGSESITLPSSVLVGVAVTSHVDGAVAGAMFENLTVR